HAVGLDDQVQVVPLDRVVNHPDAEPAARLAQGLLDGLRPPVATQIASARLHPHRDVQRMPRRKVLALEMRHAWAIETRMGPRPRPAGALASTASKPELERGLTAH